jgi:hypothetical protein
MKKLSISVIVALFAITGSVAQSLQIVPKKVIYRRKGFKVEDYKRTFEVTYPVIRTELPAGVRRRLLKNLDYWRAFDWSGHDFSLLGEINGDNWVDNLGYEVKYNNHGILDVWLTMDGSGAYPDSSTKFVVLDIRTGNRLSLSDLFQEKTLPSIRNLIRTKMKNTENILEKEMKDELQQVRELDPEFYPPPEKLELKSLAGFSISNRGVTFIYNYDYPHVSEALEPPGRFFIPYSQLKPFIRRDGLLARFVG